MAGRSSARSIDDYIAEFPAEVRGKLEQVRALVKEVAPGATETISYAIPTLDLNGRHLVHFAGYKNHIGFYPGSKSVLLAFAHELEPYKRGAGSVQFPLGGPLPLDLIRSMVRLRVEEESARAQR